MRAIHIPRLDLVIRGIAPATVAEGLRAFPVALAAHLERAPEAPMTGPVRFTGPAAADVLRQRLARRVAADVRLRTRPNSGGE